MATDNSEGHAGVPFTRFTGDVCQVTTTALDSGENVVFEYIFSSFSKEEKFRRFAGDIISNLRGYTSRKRYNLPRGRYSAIAGGSSDIDFTAARQLTPARHLGQELSAYQSRESLNDGTLLRHPSVSENPTPREDDSQIRVVITEETKSKVLNSDIGHGLNRKAKNAFATMRANSRESNVYEFTVPFDVSALTIDKCIDLRYPTTQSWFFETFRLGVRDWPGYGFDAARVPIKVNISSSERSLDTSAPSFKGNNFLKMLPGLMNPFPGGGYISQVIGAFLRRIGSEAFVFPSARCDFISLVHGSNCLDSYGWNLVDYRGADVPKSPQEEGIIFRTAPESLVEFLLDPFVSERVPLPQELDSLEAPFTDFAYLRGNPWFPYSLPVGYPVGGDPVAGINYPFGGINHVYDGEYAGSIEVYDVEHRHRTKFVRLDPSDQL